MPFIYDYTINIFIFIKVYDHVTHESHTRTCAPDSLGKIPHVVVEVRGAQTFDRVSTCTTLLSRASVTIWVKFLGKLFLSAQTNSDISAESHTHCSLITALL